MTATASATNAAAAAPAATPAAAAAAAAAAADDLFCQGVRLHQQKNYSAAAEVYRQVLAAQPAKPLHADCLHSLGALLVQQHGAKQSAEALRLVQAAIQLAPSNARYRHSLGVVHEAAQQWALAADAFERAVEKQPSNTQARMHLARALKSAGQLARAADVYRSVLQLQPCHRTASYKLGSVLRQMGKHEAAAAAYRQHLQQDPNHVQAAFWLSALTRGPQVAACPPEVVAQLFDGYSDHFDEHLVNTLGYKTPGMLMECLLQYAKGAATSAAVSPPEQQQQQAMWARCADLGCGTGLMGPLLRPHTQQLAGVDLSGGMVQKARERGCYDELAVDELVQYLVQQQQQGASKPFDLLVAADVLVYVGDLAPLLTAAARVSTDRAVFAFSTELLKPGTQAHSTAASVCDVSQPFVLQPTGRYAHSQEYLQQVAQQCGWHVVHMAESQIRQNAGQPIWGTLCLLQRV